MDMGVIWNNLRICFVSSYPPNHARLSEYAQNLVKAIAKQPTIEKLYLLVDKSTNAEVPSLNDDSKVKVLRVWEADNFLSILDIMQYLLKLKPDVVHFNMAFQSFGKTRVANFTGITLIFLCRILGFRTLVEMHNLAEKVKLERVGLKSSLVNRIGILVATKLILTAPKVVVTVRSYANHLKTRYHHRGIQYIPHGAIVDYSSSVDPEEKNILIFGFMGPHKGFSVLLKAFQELRKEKRKLNLVVAGSNHPNFPGFLDEYIKLHIPNVEFLGYVPEENVAQIFKKADIVAIPYFTMTGTSGVFHLACGYGKPIVCSDLPEIREMLNDGASALLCPPGNVEELKNAILKILSDEKLKTEMIRRNLEFAQRESWSIVAQAFEKAYLELLNF
jgi:glycosyltransferase involved in cell wall biosynthesis